MPDPNRDPSRLPPSLWAETAEPAPATAPLPAGEHRCDLLVIGAGFTGLSAALHAAREGIPTMVLEAAEIGWGASGRNNGLAIPALTRADPDVLVAAFGPDKGESVVSILRDSAQFLFDLVRTHDIRCEARQTGWLQPAHRASRMALARARHAQWQRRGAPVDLLDRDQVEALTGTRFWHGGWINRSGGHINPLGFARGLARAAIDAGAQVCTRSPVTALARDGDGWRATTPQGAVRARAVVLATHGYTGLFAPSPWPDLARTMVPTRSYQMATRPIPPALRAGILPTDVAMSDTHNDLHFAHWDAEGRLVTGGALVIPLGYAHRLRTRISDRWLRVYPQLAALGTLQFDHVWHGYFASTPDRIPRFHRLADGVVTWLGCNGRGVALGTALGPVLADAALGRAEALARLPFEAPRPVAAQAVVKRLAMAAMLYYRWMDGRD